MNEKPAFEVARKVADTVLAEGYVLYPYRASAQKNQMRWQFGVLAPKDASSSEAWFAQTECLVEPDDDPELDVVVRFLQVQTRTGDDEIPWDEGVVQEVGTTAALGREQDVSWPFHVDGGEDVEGGTVRHRWPLSGVVGIRTERVKGPYGLLRVRVRVENHSDCDPSAPREAMLRRSLVATHTLLAVRDGVFVSLLDPPIWASDAAASCDNRHTWPVLIGDGRRDVMLSAPIILYDYPEVAAESPADFCDATEIDELLALRTATLTDEEKAEARATDERAAAIIDQVDGMPPGMLERLHGAVRYLRGSAGERAANTHQRAAHARSANPGNHSPNPPYWDPGRDSTVSPETDSVPVAGGRAAKGTRVRLWPGGQGVDTGGGRHRRTDAQDMFIQGLTATVAGVFFDVDGGSYLAVTLDDDPAAELHEWFGRYHYFSPDEVEVAEQASEGGR